MFKLAIIGSGPSGLSAAAHAAELGVPHVLLESEQHASDTIYKYQKGKYVMAEPNVLPLRSPLAFQAGTREQVLGAWGDGLTKHNVNIRYGAGVTAIEGEKGAFTIRTADGKSLGAEAVVLAIGLQGNLRKLGVPGENLAVVQYQLDDPKQYEDETIIVVGAGDAAIENAVALAEQNRVIMINRNEEFARCKDGNLALILAAIRDGKLECRYGTSTAGVEMIETDGRPARFDAKTPAGIEHIGCDRVIARLGAIPPRKLVESFGIKFPNNDPAAVPQLSDTYESNVPGLYIVGALGGYPLIKQAMNQGYEVVEYIVGNAVEPADEPLLKQKFEAWGRAPTVSQALAIIQRNVPLLSGITTLQLREFMLDSEVRTPDPDEIIFERNDYTNTFYSVVEGEVFVQIGGDNGASSRWVRLGTGEFFGELGLISGRRRAATVKAGKDCVLIETPRRSIVKLIASVDSVRKAVDAVFLKRAVRAYISQELPEADLDHLVEDAQVKKYDGGDPLFNEGDAGDGLYLLRRGSVTISRKIGGHEVVLSYVAAGNYVGELALLTDKPRTATIRAAVATEAIVLDGARFKQTLQRHPKLREEVEAQLLSRIRANVAMEAQVLAGTVTSYLMQQGIGEATDVLLIDESLCIRCNNCEKACADVHEGTSRLNREAGPTYAQIHVPTSCRHCEHPHCMKDCPPDAINRAPNGEVYIRDTCIGCGNCERNCPYGVIQMAPINPNRQRPKLWQWLLWGEGDEPGVETKVYDKLAVKKAVKCDMCKDLPHGPACVSACPTGAALRVSPEKFLDYTNAIEA
ncbi:MAG TPA: cyclic nucleotide-binding domain-containing protein [Casimicrobiaceae bacterium]|jgi:CRP-like cAMP-binding protein/Fe-S-cluster-containing hydrogenase component 2/thioredoxin reductase|nr:cyclic nucleotide-binding domain-containing protein [Casimicrobiaceae bacterium]